MADTTYTYDISSETANGRVNTQILENEIQASSITVGVRRIDTAGGSKQTNGVVTGGSMDVVMKDAITKADLDTIVSNHQGNENIQKDLVDIGLPTTADGTLQTSKQQLELGRAPFRREDNQSQRLNINGTSTGTPTNIFDGTSPSDPLTDWDVSGIGSVKAIAGRGTGNGYDSELTASLGQRITFDSGLMQNIRLNFKTLEFYIQFKNLVSGGIIRIGWQDENDQNVGTFVSIANYVSDLDLDEWKKVTIPISDFGLQNNEVQKLVFRFLGLGLRVWLDDISLISREDGGPYIFRISAPTGEIFNVERLILTMSAPDTGWASTSFGNIADGLENGLLFRYRFLDGYTMWSFNCRNNSELFGQLSVLNSINFNDSELTIVFALEPELSSVVLVDDDEVLEIIVRDNLSSLTNMRAFLHYGVEKIPT